MGPNAERGRGLHVGDRPYANLTLLRLFGKTAKAATVATVTKATDAGAAGNTAAAATATDTTAAVVEM